MAKQFWEHEPDPQFERMERDYQKLQAENLELKAKIHELESQLARVCNRDASFRQSDCRSAD